MKRFWSIGLVVLAMLTAAAVTTASASAELPEFMVCKKVTGKVGHYTTSACTEESKVETGGEYELEKGLSKKISFTAKSGKATLSAPEEPERVVCKSSSTTGEFAGAKQVQDVVIKASGCEAYSAKCTSAGAAAGHITSNPLKGEFGYLAGRGTKTPTVGLLVSEESSTYAAEFDCEGVEVRSQGPIIAEATGNINTVSTEATYTFRQSNGVQQYTSFEGGGLLEGEWHWEFNVGKGFEPEGGDLAGLELTATSTQGAFEIKA